MANDKNIINELVTEDDDPTAELETLADTYDFVGQKRKQVDPSITELESDLQNRTETIDRLQFDIEQLRAKWAGLEVEIEAREDLTKDLTQKLSNTREKLARKEMLLTKRDQQIECLEKDLREDRGADFEAQQLISQRQSGELASAKAEVGKLRAQLERMESYADDIRQKLQERTSITDRAENTRESLQGNLDHLTHQVEQFESELEQARASGESLANELVSTKESHAEEIRLIRFELGEAQDTVIEHELVTEQLASDLVNTREFRDDLERVLNETEEQTQSRIEELERENRKLKDDLAHNEEQLESKSEALTCLLAELTKKSQQIESIGEIEDVIHEIDDRMSERFDDRTHKERDRVTRVLIGSVDGQELRFPLFKDRLTIGRTDQNDIKLQASCVSRRHAVIVSDRDATRVVDWGSKNGVFVNSVRITEHFLRNGDNLTIGTAEFRYEERPKRDN
jgi:chromosome segregation ATPase